MQENDNLAQALKCALDDASKWKTRFEAGQLPPGDLEVISSLPMPFETTDGVNREKWKKSTFFNSIWSEPTPEYQRSRLRMHIFQW